MNNELHLPIRAGSEHADVRPCQDVQRSIGIRCKNCYALLSLNHLFLQEFASIVVEERRAKPFDDHITNHACFRIHREVEEDDDHHQKVQEIEQSKSIFVEARLEGIHLDAVFR